jgi:hypothetical protein
MFEDDVLTLDVPEGLKTFMKSGVIRPFFVGATCVPENTDSGNPAGLRMRNAWQRSYRAADECEEVTSLHQLYLDRLKVAVSAGTSSRRFYASEHAQFRRF